MAVNGLRCTSSEPHDQVGLPVVLGQYEVLTDARQGLAGTFEIALEAERTGLLAGADQVQHPSAKRAFIADATHAIRMVVPEACLPRVLRPELLGRHVHGDTIAVQGLQENEAIRLRPGSFTPEPWIR